MAIGGFVVWAVMQYGVWKLVDAAAARAFTPWVFAVGHLMYGAVTAAFVAQLVPGVVTTRQGLQH